MNSNDAFFQSPRQLDAVVRSEDSFRIGAHQWVLRDYAKWTNKHDWKCLKFCDITDNWIASAFIFSTCKKSFWGKAGIQWKLDDAEKALKVKFPSEGRHNYTSAE